MKPQILCFIFLLFTHTTNGQGISREAIENNIFRQIKVYPQEKIHLHLDRDFYVPGERIWFKAYLVDAATHEYPAESRYVYVELINSIDSVISRVMIRPEGDLHYGHIFLSEVIPEGYYTVRAYTKYMENLGEDYFFMENIQIGNLNSMKAEQTKNQKKKKKDGKIKEDFDVGLFPEGGNLLDRTMCRIAFKAIKSNGLSEDITGEVIDEEGLVLAKVKTFHAGMGVFSFIPVKGKTYYLNCHNSKGLDRQFKIPDAKSGCYSLLTSRLDKKLWITPLKSADIKRNEQLYLLLHIRGHVLYFNKWDNTKQHISFLEDHLPGGIIQILLFDSQMNPLSERLVFSKNFVNDTANLDFETDKENYETRELITSTLKLKDNEGKPLNGNISVAITDDKDITVNTSQSIVSTFLLTSELKGYIEDPGYYFEDNDNRRNTALDYLMLTQGWRRYNLPEIIKGNIEYPDKPIEVSQTVYGAVKTLMLAKPVPNSEVTLLSSEGYIGQTEADRNGRFIFNGFESPDSTTYYVQSLGKKGSSRVQLLIDEYSYPLIKHLPSPFTDEIIETDTFTTIATKDAFMEKAEQRAKYDDQMRIVHLKNIEVVAAKIEKDKSLPWYTAGSDATITREKIERHNPIFVSDMLHGIAGLQVFSNGTVSIRRGGLPLVLIDGIPMEWSGELITRFDSPLEMVNINNIERIDVFKGASASVFGTRGGNGAISIVTRRGAGSRESKSFNQIVLNPLGYQKPVEFYSPKYDTPELKTGNPDYRTTIFWKPDIITNENGEASFDFYTSDFKTNYSVVIEGISKDGRMIHTIKKIRVE